MQRSSWALPLLLAGCGAATGKGPGHAPPAPELGEHHPLRGRIWDARARAFIDEQTLAARLAAASHVLLGEKHDNPRHHQIQALLLRALVDAGRRPALVWEMITDEEAPALDRFLRSGARDPDKLGAALRWEERGWPPWSIYRPVAAVALEAGLSLVAAGIDRRQLMELAHGPTSQPAAARLPAAAEADLAQEVREAHCGHSTPGMERMMVRAQQRRDSRMARRMLGHGGGAVLIAGNGHARRDRGVPFQLRALDPAARAVSLGIVEVQGGETRPEAYAAGAPGLGPAYDYIWLTRRVDNVDPCARFREQLERMRGKR